MPELLYVQDLSEPCFGLDDETCEEEPIDVRHDGGRAVVLRQAGSTYVQVVGDDRASRGTVYGRQGCIDRLQAALAQFRGGKWSQARIAEIWSDGAANERRLRRLNAVARVGIDIVTTLARNYALRPEDLAFLHTAGPTRPRRRRRSADPFLALRRERERAELDMLSRFKVRLCDLTETNECDKFASDLLHGATKVRIENRWWNAPSDVEGLAAKVASFRQLIENNTWRLWPSKVDELSNSIVAAMRELMQAGFSIRIGRYIGVRKAELTDDDQLNISERHVIVLIEPQSMQASFSVDLGQDQTNRPSAREIDLNEGDTEAALRSIRRDINWCGHWEGRWMPVWPQPAPDWLKQQAGT
jgi:hypothetical protein